ncbi:hypothetical protein HAX54_011267 [Datura stramonium]|uniref:Uncharacterized protein n=1 Tax=Datura stramonium TaxID=4076 RepID=A0ABS8TJD4_DATST|nr:hypothetical protein [Datura stramonium]
MFQHFLSSIRPDHPDQVFMHIEEIMSMIIKESEEIPLQLLNILISSVEKENQKSAASAVIIYHGSCSHTMCYGVLYFYPMEKVINVNGAQNPRLEKGPEQSLVMKKLPSVFRTLIVKLLRKVGPSFPGSKSPTNDGYGELAPHAAPERVAPQKELDPEATQASKKRDWKPKFLNKPEEGYDDAWISGERRSKGRILLKDRGEDTKKRSSSSTKCAISSGLYLSSGEEKAPIMTSIKRRQMEKNDQTCQNDGVQFPSISARDAPGARTKKKVPTVPIGVGSVFSITKESNPFAKTKEQRRGKNLPSQENALGSVSNTKESNFPETSKEQRKRKNSPSQEKEWGSFSITKKRNFPKTSKKQRKGKNSLSQDEALSSVSITKQSNFTKASKEQHKRENSPSKEEDSVDKVVTKHGEELVGCRIRVWWPLDQVFYEGHITFFDCSKKKHMVTYEDGYQEKLNLTKEHWELVDNDDTSDPIQEIVPGPSDLSGKRLGCIIDSCRRIRKKKKGKAADDPTPPTMTVQHNITPKGVHQNKGIMVESSESGVEGNPMSLTTPIKGSPEERVDVHGCKVKLSNAPVLAAIFAKYGDITVKCPHKSLAAKTLLLDVVSDVVRKLKTGDFSVPSIKAMKSVVSNAAAAKLDVTWLQQYLDEISEVEDMEKKSSYLMALSETTMLVSKAAKKDLVEMNSKVLTAKKRLKKAERRLQEAKRRAGEAKRSVKVFKILGEKVQQDIKEAKDQAKYWQSRLNDIL